MILPRADLPKPMLPIPRSSARPPAVTRRRQRGITLLEIMIVLAIVGASLMLVRSGFRMVTKADLAENAVEMVALMRRANQMAIETGSMHRILIDLDKHEYVIEVCEGAAGIARNEAVRASADAKERAILRMEGRLQGSPQTLATDAEDATKKALALAGHHIADRTCEAAQGGIELMNNKTKEEREEEGSKWKRKLRTAKGIKFREVWVQHQEKGTSDGQVAIYFFPIGSAEKAVIELTDGSDVFSILLYGLTSLVELRDGALQDVEDHMLRDIKGDRIKDRESSR